MEKQAYLIIAHDKFEQLYTLLKLLDDSRNDIYIHIDKRANIPNGIYAICKYSKVIILENRIKVEWGMDSQVKVELLLLEKSTESFHTYYHLLSGVDLPLKSQDEIIKKFSTKSALEGIQYVGFDYKRDYSSRAKYYHFFKKYYLKRNFNNNNLILRIYQKIIVCLDGLSLITQEKIGINKLSAFNIEKVAKGSNWFSITHQFAEYLNDNKNLILKMAKSTNCFDELFVQTMLVNSKFYDSKYLKYQVDSNLRYIDWEKGGPYTYKLEDFDDLINSDKYFARKFNFEIDSEIIDKIYRHLRGV